MMASDRLRSIHVRYFDIVIVQFNPSKSKGFRYYVVSYFNDCVCNLFIVYIYLPVLQVPLVLQLFDTLHALCNLLVVAPDNLKQVCSGEQLTNLDRNLLHAFVQLRVDYRSARLGRHFS